MAVTVAVARFDFARFIAAVDGARTAAELNWYEVAELMWDQSAELNVHRDDHPLCGGAVGRLGGRGETSCQYAMFLLRWIGRSPEDFLDGPSAHRGSTRIPDPGPGRRLRWDLARLHGELNEERQRRGLTWAALADELDCTPSRLTNLRTARQADLALTMRVTQWLRRPAAAFVDPADW